MEARRWNQIEIDFGDEETVNFGKRQEFAAPGSLYYLQTLALIGPNDDKENRDASNVDFQERDEPPSLLSASNGTVVAVAVGSDLSLFTIEPFQFNEAFLFDKKIQSLCFIPDCEILVVALSEGDFAFISLRYFKMLFRKNPFKNSTGVEFASVRCGVQNGNCSIFALLRGGPLVILRLENIRQWTDAVRNNDIAVLRQLLPTLKVDRLPLPNTQWRNLTVNSDQFLLLMPFSDSPFYLTDDKGTFSLLEECQVKCDYRSAELSSDGHFCIFLLTDGRLSLWDLWTLTHLAFLPITGVTDFMFLDTGERLAQKSLLLLRKLKESSDLTVEIRTLPDCGLVYSVAVHSFTSLVRSPPDRDGWLFVAELTPPDQGSQVRLRSIVAAHPETRLTRLLNKRQFTEAETFAKQFGLDLQLVYKTEMNFLLGQLQNEPDNTSGFKRFLWCLDSLQEVGCVLEGCVSAAALLPRHDWIVAVLSFAQRRFKDDAQILPRVNAVKERLITYKLVLGPGNPFSPSRWNTFLNTKSWLNVLLSFIDDGLIEKAAIVWVRYEWPIRDELLHNSSYKAVLDKMSVCVQKNLCSVADLVNFAEHHIVPAFLFDEPEKAGPLVADWLQNMCRWLEVGAPTNWPQNALHVSQMVKRVIESWWLSDGVLSHAKVTPEQQARAASCWSLALVDPDSDQGPSPMGNLTKLTDSLWHLHRLHTVYQCRLTYAQFEKEKRESICYRILDRTQAVELLARSVEQFARPYMKEHCLNEDETLHRYVLDISEHSLSSAAISSTEAAPWEDRSAVIIGCMSSVELSCRSVIAVAHRAQVPWSSAVTELVRKTLECKLPMVKELHTQRNYAELRQILSKYLIGGQSLFSSLNNRGRFERLICYILSQEQESVLQDALDAARLSDKMNQDDVYVRYLAQLLSLGNLDKIWAVLEQLDAVTASKYAQRLFNRTVVHLNMNWTNSESAVEKRTRLLECTISIVTRFSTDADKEENLNRLRLILRLQLEFGRIVTWHQFCDRTYKLSLLNDIVLQSDTRISSDPVGGFFRLTFCLDMEREDAVLAAADTLLKNGGAASIVLLLVKRLLDVTRPDRKCLESLFGVICSLMVQHFEKPTASIVSQIDLLLEVMAKISCDLSENLLPPLLQITHFLHLCRLVTRRCDVPVTAENASKHDENVRSNTEFQLQSDGLLLQLSDVAPLVARAGRWLLARMERRDSEQCDTALDELMQLLQLHEQKLLQLMLLLFKYELVGCDLPLVELEGAISAVFGQVVTRAPSKDYVLSLSLLLTLPDTQARQLVLALHQRLSGHQNRALSAVISTAECVAQMQREQKMLERLRRMRLDVLWSSRLAKWGVADKVSGSNQQRIEFVPRMAQKGIFVETVCAFCADFELDLNDALCVYLKSLLTGVCDGNDRAVLTLADAAFEHLSVSSDAVIDRMHNLLLDLDPYAYDQIEFLLGKFVQFSLNPLFGPSLDKITQLLQFLTVYERRQPMSNGERDWLMGRASARGTNNQNQQPADESTFSFGDTKSPQHKVQDAVALSPLSANRLPFHAFLPQPNGQPEDVLISILQTELCLENVKLWQNFVDSCPVRLSKNQMVGLAVDNAVRMVGRLDANKATILLDNQTIASISTLLCHSDRAVAIKCAMTLAKKLACGEPRIRAVQIGIDVAEAWINDDNEQKPMAEKYLKSFVRASQSMGTEYLLAKYGLLDDDTKRLVNAPAELMEMLCQKYVPDRSKEGQISEVIELIGRLYKIDIGPMRRRLIEKWLRSSTTQCTNSDPDETAVLGLGLGVESEPGRKVLPFLDKDISRVVFLLRMEQRRKTAYDLVGIVNQESTTGTDGWLKLRALCCLFRLLTPTQMTALLSISIQQLRSILCSLLYLDELRAVSLSTYTMQTFDAANKQSLLNALWHNHPHSSIPLCRLMSHLVLDFDLDCPLALFEQLVQRLLNSNPQNVHQLLLLCQKRHNLCTTNSIGLFWTKLLHIAVANVKLPIDDERRKICVGAFLFLARCPNMSDSALNSVVQTFCDLTLSQLANCTRLMALQNPV